MSQDLFDTHQQSPALAPSGGQSNNASSSPTMQPGAVEGVPVPGLPMPVLGGGGTGQNAMSTLFPQASTSTDPQQQQAQQQQNLNLGTEIKRLQQLHQMNTQGTAPNALLMTGQAPQNQAALLQSIFDQKVQNDAIRQTAVAAAPFNPVFQPGLLQDARLLMAQNNMFAAAMGGAAAGSEVPLPSPHSLFHRDGSRRMRGGVIEPFPEKLHRLLSECELANRADVISWVANGRAFAIHKPDKFFKEIVPLYFRQSRLSSFKRQLNLYGFELINTGPSRGGYFHELFVKERPELCRRMRRVAVKVSNPNKGSDDGPVKTEAPIVADGSTKEGDIADNNNNGDIPTSKEVDDQAGVVGLSE